MSSRDPADHGFDPDALDAVYANLSTNPDLRALHSLLVVRHGVLVVEQYFNGFDALWLSTSSPSDM